MNIDITALPSVPIAGRGLLPPIAAVYFALDDTGVVLYIGQSVDVRRRWRIHEQRTPEMARIAWVPCTPRQLANLEKRAILALRPPLNTQWKRPEPLILNDGREKTVVTTTQAAVLLGVSRAAVQKAVQQGRIAAASLGRDKLIEREEVERYRRERKMTGPRGSKNKPPTPTGD